MNASMFLASFLGCLFALMFVAIGVFGYLKWKTRRFIAMNAAEVAHRMKREMSPDEERAMQEFMREMTKPGQSNPVNTPK